MNQSPSITFPLSRIEEFKSQLRPSSLRVGQAFYNYMELHKITSPNNRAFCDKLHCTDGEQAWNMIYAHACWES